MIIKVTNARICFCQNLFIPVQVLRQGEEKYSATFLLSHPDPQVNVIRSQIRGIAVDKWGARKAPTILKDLEATDKVFLRDGNKKTQYDGFEGCVYFNASRGISKGAPTIIDRDKMPLTVNDGKIYAGCFVDVSIDAYAQDNEWGKRINAVLRAVRFQSDGEALGGSAPANEDEFDDITDTGESSTQDTPPDYNSLC